MIRKARLADGPAIQKLINAFADKGKMLPRPLAEIYENIREYFVASERGRIVGTAALHINWDDLARSSPWRSRKGSKNRGWGGRWSRPAWPRGNPWGSGVFTC